MVNMLYPFKKRGDYKFEILIILILGLVVVSIVFYFLFNEYFTGDDINLEVCRESIIIRNTLPERDLGPHIVSLKEEFPLKCRNSVIEIDYEDTEKAEREFAEALVTCWFLYGNGDYGVFPTNNWESNGFCTLCSRIHINSDVKDFYKGENRIDFSRAISREFDNGNTFYEYLKNVGSEDPFKYVVPGEGFQGETFEILEGKRKVSPDFSAPDFLLPKYYNPDNGDIFILFENFITPEGKNNVANLIYFQKDNAKYKDESLSAIELISDFEKSSFYKDGVIYDSQNSFCSDFDGIPV